MHYKCIILVIASHDPSYDGFKKLWQEHWNQLPGYELFFLYNDPNKPMHRENNDLYFQYEETYPAPGLLLKTIGALEYLKDHQITYDMIFRTNLSTMINWKAFDEFVDKHRHKRFFGGVSYGDKRISGYGMFISADLVQNIMENKDKLDFNLPDDHAINLYLEPMNLNYIYIDSARPTDKEQLKDVMSKNIILFRFHSGWTTENENRKIDIQDMQKNIGYLKELFINHFETIHSSMIISAFILFIIYICYFKY